MNKMKKQMSEKTGQFTHRLHVKITAFLLVFAMACTAMATAYRWRYLLRITENVETICGGASTKAPVDSRSVAVELCGIILVFQATILLLFRLMAALLRLETMHLMVAMD